MKKMRMLVFTVSAIVVMLCAGAMAQSAGDQSTYFVTYFSNNVSGAPDATLRFINDGDSGYNLWAEIYVFDDSQEMAACGQCGISPDGLLSEDVKTELTNNPLTGRVPTRGVIKVISSYYDFGPTQAVPYPGLRGWETHIQRATPTSGVYATTEARVANANLIETEQSLLQTLCYYVGVLGSGQGTVTCTPEDQDF
jgi:hypothetical protein